MKSVSGTHAVHQPDRGRRGDLGPVRQRPRRRRQRLPGQHHRVDHPAAVPGRHPAADRADRAHRHRVRHHRDAGWTASTDNVGVRAYDIYRDGSQGRHGHRHRAARRPRSSTAGWRPAPPTSYYVVARDAQANVSPRSNTATVTTGAACGNPVCGGHADRHRHRHPVGPGRRCPTARPLQPPRRPRHHPPQPGHRGQDHASAPCPNVQSTDGEGGLLGLAISADFADRPLAVHHAHLADRQPDRPDQAARTARSTPAASRSCVSGILRNKYHNGGRLRFGPDGKLYASTGDAQNGDNAQNLTSLERQGPAAQPGRHASRRTTRSATTSGATATATRRAWRSTRRAGCGSRSSATRSWTRPT